MNNFSKKKTGKSKRSNVVIFAIFAVLLVIFLYILIDKKVIRKGGAGGGEGIGESLPPENDAPGAAASERALAGKPVKVKDATVYTIDLPVDLLTGDFVWLDEGEAFCALNKKGILYRVSVPGLKLLKTVDLKHEVSDMALSREGLAVVLNTFQEVWLIDPADLTVKGWIPSPEPYFVATSPNLGIAFVAGKDGGKELTTLDLENREIVNTRVSWWIFKGQEKLVKRFPESHPLYDFKRPLVTRDGDYFITFSAGGLHRCRISDTALTHEEAGPRAVNYNSVEFSYDGRYVVYAGSSNPPEEYPKVEGNPTYVHDVTDLAAPIAAFSRAPYSGGLAIDGTGEMVFVMGSRFQLVTFSFDGTMLEEYTLTRQGDRVLTAAPHPQGRKTLILTAEKLLWVELE